MARCTDKGGFGRSVSGDKADAIKRISNDARQPNRTDFFYFSAKLPNSKFIAIYPYPTLIINVIGSIVIGFVSHLLLTKFPNYNTELKHFFIIGFLGGFTTFSSFALEAINLLHNNYFYYFSLYILLRVIICLVGCFFGILLAKYIIIW